MYVVATDVDTNENGQITYSLEDPTGFFKIDESGWIEIKEPITGVNGER